MKEKNIIQQTLNKISPEIEKPNPIEIDKKIRKIAKDPKIKSGLKELNNMTGQEITAGSTNMKQYSYLVKQSINKYNEKHGEKDKKYNTKDLKNSELSGKWILTKNINKIKKLANIQKNIQKNIQIDPNLNYKLSVIYITNGEGVKNIFSNMQKFSKILEQKICELQKYSHVGDHEDVDGYYISGTKKIPVQIKAYYTNERRVYTGGINTNTYERKIISEEWRYYIFDNNFKQLDKSTPIDDDKTAYVLCFPVFLTNPKKLINSQDLTYVSTSQNNKTFKKVINNLFIKKYENNPKLLEEWKEFLSSISDDNFIAFGPEKILTFLKKHNLIDMIETVKKLREFKTSNQLKQKKLKMDMNGRTKIDEEIKMNFFNY